MLRGLTVNSQTGEIAIARGDDQSIQFTVTDSTGAVVNVSAGSFAFTVKASIDDPIGSAKFQKTSGGGGIDLSGGVSGIVTVTIAAADTQGFTGLYVWDLQMILAGNTRTLAGGRFTIRKDVTTPGVAGNPTNGVILFPGGIAIGSDGTLYLPDKTNIGFWTGIRINGAVFEQSAAQSASIPFSF